MDQERYIAEPNQVLHPGRGRTERYNDSNGAVYETTHLDAHGNAFTQNHQLGPAERYGYNYVGADAPTPSAPRTWVQPAAGAATVAGLAGAGAAYHDYATDFRDRDSSSDEDGALGIALLLIFLVLVALGPLFLGVWMFRRARRRGTTTTHAAFAILMEGAWLAVLWAWLFDGGTPAGATAFAAGAGAATWYLMTLRAERR